MLEILQLALKSLEFVIREVSQPYEYDYQNYSGIVRYQRNDGIDSSSCVIPSASYT